MNTIIIIILIIFGIINVVLFFTLNTIRSEVKKRLENHSKIEPKNHKDRIEEILFELSKGDELKKEYVIYCAPILIYRMGASMYSLIATIMQWILIIIVIYSLVKFNFALLIPAILLIGLSGHNGSRFNDKLVQKNFFTNSKVIKQNNERYDIETYQNKLNDFHDKFYEEVTKLYKP
ncbi:MAG: hypothetical protein Q8Q37_01480 [bacterium]|nr:hypothetical protein [bacterium]